MMDLRTLTATDVALLEQLYTDPKQMRFIHGAAAIDIHRLVAQMCQAMQQQPPRFAYWVIVDRDTQVAQGLLSATEICWTAARAELGIMLLPQYQAKGLAVQAFLSLMQWLHARGIRHFYSQMHPDNHAAKRLVRQCAMTPCAAQSQANPGFYWVERIYNPA